MRIKLRGQFINIILSDGKSINLQRPHFKELYNALTLIKELVDCESLESVDLDFGECREIWNIEPEGGT